MQASSRITALEQDALYLQERIDQLKQEGYQETAARLANDLEHIRALIAYDKAKQERRHDRA